jgi:hypothetical protein
MISIVSSGASNDLLRQELTVDRLDSALNVIGE